MLRAILVVAFAVGAAVAAGAIAPAERQDIPAISALGQGTIDRDDFDGGNGGDGANG